MKKSKLLLAFAIVNLVLILIAILNLPEKVIFKFTNDIIVNEYVGRWFNIILPIIALISALVIFIIDIVENGVKKHTYRYLIAYVGIAVCSYFSWVLIGIQSINANMSEKLVYPIYIMTLLPIAYFMFASSVDMLYRNIEDNSIFGFSWVKSNLIVWDKTKKLAGKLGIVVGFVFVLIAILNDLVWGFRFMFLIAIAIWVVYYLFVICYSKYLHNRY